jgi:hypothetical protein
VPCGRGSCRRININTCIRRSPGDDRRRRGLGAAALPHAGGLRAACCLLEMRRPDGAPRSSGGGGGLAGSAAGDGGRRRRRLELILVHRLHHAGRVIQVQLIQPVQAFPSSIFHGKNRCDIGKSQSKWTAKDVDAWRTRSPERAWQGMPGVVGAMMTVIATIGPALPSLDCSLLGEQRAPTSRQALTNPAVRELE